MRTPKNVFVAAINLRTPIYGIVFIVSDAFALQIIVIKYISNFQLVGASTTIAMTRACVRRTVPPHVPDPRFSHSFAIAKRMPSTTIPPSYVFPKRISVRCAPTPPSASSDCTTASARTSCAPAKRTTSSRRASAWPA